MSALQMVFRRLEYLGLGAASFLAMLILLLWSSQVVTLTHGEVHVFMAWHFIGAATVMAVLFGMVFPLQVYATRVAAATARGTRGMALAGLLGTASMSCCTPVILPSLLSLLGFSGIQILRFNVTVERFWLPLATMSVVLLLYSVVSLTDSLDITCDVHGGKHVSL